MAAAREVATADGREVYGLTTGLGALRGVAQDEADRGRFNELTIQAHTTAHGPAVHPEVVRAAMVHRVNAFARGFSTARPEVAEALVSVLNDDDPPVVHAVGSIGQSDLPAMAEIARGLLRRGLVLEGGEALSLLNANSLSTGHAALAVADVRSLARAYDAVAALSLEAFGANLSILHPALADARPFTGLRDAAVRLRELLAESPLWEPGAARNLQDPLTFRCIPQLHGAFRDALAYAVRQLETELNASGDNPMVASGAGDVVSVGNFDVTPLAAALDLLRIAFAQLLTASGERVQKLLAGHHSGLPTGLRADDGPDDALAILGVGAASLAGEARLLAMPVALELPTSSVAAG